MPATYINAAFGFVLVFSQTSDPNFPSEVYVDLPTPHLAECESLAKEIRDNLARNGLSARHSVRCEDERHVGDMPKSINDDGEKVWQGMKM